MVRFFPHSKFHGKAELTGSDYIRCQQLLKYWKDADIYKYGENPDCLIFNKIFCSEDYKFPTHFEGKKILDVCDPMWLEGSNILETCHAVDVVTTSTQALADYIKQFKNEVVVVPDRFDLERYGEPKKHIGRAKTVVWFGYLHNSDALKPALKIIEELKLNLIIISNQDPLDLWRARDKYTFIKYNEDTILDEFMKADFAILPDGLNPKDVFKSNNRTIKINLCGIPVAKTPEEVNHYMIGANRQQWVIDNYANIKSEYDIRNSVKELKRIIDAIQR